MSNTEIIFVAHYAIAFALIVIAIITAVMTGKYIWHFVKKTAFATEHRGHCIMHLFFSAHFLITSTLMFYAISLA